MEDRNFISGLFLIYKTLIINYIISITREVSHEIRNESKELRQLARGLRRQ